MYVIVSPVVEAPRVTRSLFVGVFHISRSWFKLVPLTSTNLDYTNKKDEQHKNKVHNNFQTT
jgi:hypothetical protein